MKMTTAQKQDNEIFRRIFEENWEDFKEEHPAFDCDQYEKPVQKMLNCGKDSGGYCEYICMQCGRVFVGFALVVKVVSAFHVVYIRL